MKLSQFKEILDEISASAKEDLDVVLDIEPSAGGEYLVDIGEVFVSRMNEGKLKIQPKIELDTHKERKRMLLESDLPSRIIDIRCPNCHHVLSGRYPYCKHCGQPLYTREETHEYLDEQHRLNIRRKRAAKKEQNTEK